MTADLIYRVRSAGADLQPFGTQLRVFRPDRLDPVIIEEIRREKRGLLLALRAEREAVAILGVCRFAEILRLGDSKPK